MHHLLIRVGHVFAWRDGLIVETAEQSNSRVVGTKTTGRYFTQSTGSSGRVAICISWTRADIRLSRHLIMASVVESSHARASDSLDEWLRRTQEQSSMAGVANFSD